MAENNKFIVKIIDHDNNNSILQELGYQTRERAEEFKRISDRAYGKLLGKNQTRITTELFEL
jgi:adenylylsulfate kinase-like enzyme